MSKDKKYNVLLIAATLGVGGIETYILNLLKVIDRDLFNPVVVYNGVGADTYRPEIEQMGIKVILVPNPYTQVTFLWRIARIIKKYNIGIICDFRNDFSASSLAVAKILGVRSRVTMYRSSQAGFKSNIFKAIYSAVLHNVVKKTATRIIGNTTKVLDSFYPNRGKDDRFAVVNNGVEIQKFAHDIDREKIRSELGIANDAIVVGHLGRLHESKNHSVILEVFDKLHRRLEKTHLLLVGDGPLWNDIERQIELLNIAEFVTMAGQRMDVPQMLAAMDVFVYPSIYEGMPTALVEAMAAGVAFAASNIAEISEIVPPELEGQLFNAYDVEGIEEAVYGLCTNKPKRQFVASCAKRWASANYAIEKSVSQLCEHWLTQE